LRQEFRELELLNYITKLRFEGKLRPQVAGNTRSSLIKSFQKVYNNYCPKDTPDPLKWDEEDPILRPEQDDDDFVWQKAEKSNTSQNKGVKRKRDTEPDSTIAQNLKNDIIPNIQPPKKKQRREINLHDSIRGMTWNAETWSCAYDSLLTILSSTYLKNARKWNDKVAHTN
ncbi:hypothetical protein DENSPDRAFT_756732, partial [Dentipellis sp. KUC8613]